MNIDAPLRVLGNGRRKNYPISGLKQRGLDGMALDRDWRADMSRSLEPLLLVASQAVV
jgi:hypothetical protein